MYMTKEERLNKYLKEHPNFKFETIYYIKKDKKIVTLTNYVSISVKKWKEKYPDRNKAHKIVFSAIRNKTLIKKPCFCGELKSEAHHPDYSKPLDVVWLCKKHHVEADKKRRIKNKC
jgi:hypothetical protein